MEDQGGDNMSRAPQLSTSPCRLNQSLSRLQVPGLNGADGNDTQRQLFSELEVEPSTSTIDRMREKLCLQDLITGQGNFVEKASRALIAALGLVDGTLNVTNPGIFANLPKNQKLKLNRGASSYFNDEINRRCLFYKDYVPFHRPNAWKLEKKT